MYGIQFLFNTKHFRSEVLFFRPSKLQFPEYFLLKQKERIVKILDKNVLNSWKQNLPKAS